ncbi:MAG TPA: hypothetical protein VLM79_23795 [Kofleriaceae bacterium]|nr:hypothetical protein [Kofleriaceae bacterium]
MAVGEWDQRQLCPDGACVGVIGPDGTCKVCGRAAPNWGDERKRGLIDPPDEDASEDDDDLDDDGLAADGSDGDEYDDDDDAAADDDHGHDDGDRAGLSGSSGEWGDRRLCADGTCIGVLGADGRCKVCGRTPAQVQAGAAGRAAAPAATSEAIAGTTDDKAPERSDGEAPP